MTKTSKFFAIALVVILVIVNVAFFFSIQRNLVVNQEEKIELLVRNIRGSIQENHDVEIAFNRYLAEDLRMTSIAIQNELPPDIKDVTTEQLMELEKQFRLKGVTLFVQKSDDVVSVKSSNVGEVGLSAKEMVSDEWRSMLQQLLSNHDVKPIDGFGQALDNFWAGPVAKSKFNSNVVTKWGYYNDGNTNYIINLFIERNVLDAYYDTAGVEQKLQHIIEINPFVLNVSIVNGDEVRKRTGMNENDKVTHIENELFFAGKNLYPTPKDGDCAKSALKEDKMIHQRAEVDGEEVLKSYYPALFETDGGEPEEMMVVVTSDFDMINQEFYKRIGQNLIFSLLVFLFGITAILIAVRAIERREHTLSNVQYLYNRHINSLFETMREHRHDLNHHLYTISGLSSMKLYSELDAYVKNLVTMHDDSMDIVDVSLPALSGLIQAKKVEAREEQIDFEYHFENLETLDIRLDKITDIVKAAGNILDNAFHAVQESHNLNKRVTIYGKYSNSLLILTISNNGKPIPEELMEKIFEEGMTTRTDMGGTGVGLHSSRKALERYKGTIEVESDETNTKFTIKMPISRKEIRINPKNK